MAEYRPIAPFDSAENRRKNRRIEIVIVHEKMVEKLKQEELKKRVTRKG